MKYIDLRSDTVTMPTDEMREAMFHAEVGDDVYEDDPTVKKLEAYAASLVGMEAALLVPSGTFGNQLALLTHCKRGSEVILGDDCHIVAHEVGAAAVIAGVQLRTLCSREGELDPAEVKAKIRSVDLHYPETSLICVENAHSNGRVISLENMADIYAVAQEHSLPVHLDGARLFNAAAALGVSPQKITSYCDTVMFCLSKGLCAPVGSMLAGSEEYIGKARKFRKLMGGGLRQSGILAAAGLIALEKMRDNIPEDHRKARLLGEKLAEIPGITVELDSIQINMVFFTIQNMKISEDQLVSALLERGIKANPPEQGRMRLVTHYWISEQDIADTVQALKQILC